MKDQYKATFADIKCYSFSPYKVIYIDIKYIVLLRVLISKTLDERVTLILKGLQDYTSTVDRSAVCLLKL